MLGGGCLHCNIRNRATYESKSERGKDFPLSRFMHNNSLIIFLMAGEAQVAGCVLNPQELLARVLGVMNVMA